MKPSKRNPISSIGRSQRGQGLLEYIVLVALIGVATMGMVRILQSSIKANFANVIFALQDDSRRKVSAEKISEEDLKKADFGDFMNGASSKSKD
ncbi:MAG: hypothetical protein GW917_00960 [Bdellovibrionales bacterium]|nr:hypothetical protein [Bdellovibrionales bacterium]